jgi:AcrR family transcriptional regulator
MKPMLPSAIVDEYKRRRVLEAIAALARDRQLEAIKISDIVKQAGLARKTFYDLCGGKDQAIAETLQWAASTMLGAGEEGGVEGLIGWAEEHPDALHFVLFRGPSIEGGVRYGQLLEDAASFVFGESPVGVAVVGGAVSIVAGGLREGVMVRALIEHAAEWASQYPPPRRKEAVDARHPGRAADQRKRAQGVHRRQGASRQGPRQGRSPRRRQTV